ncbi:MAG: hypothetical protein M1818_001967 [Claussenomyces sp. TS43310]|nr:MAG: hypothetical protein M1818_001967 [Claussenomyces sp. TS43310]
MDKTASNVGLQLFPPPPSQKKPSVKLNIRRHSAQAQYSPVLTSERAKSPEISYGEGRPVGDDAQHVVGTEQSVHRGPMSATNEQGSALDARYTPSPGPSFNHPSVELPRSHTSFSDAPTLVRSQSNASHGSIARSRPHNFSRVGEPNMIRSIFPRYNPELPLERQQYYPTQASPTNIPRAVISRVSYSPGLDEGTLDMGSPLSAPPTISTLPRGIQDMTLKHVDPSTTEELKALWKVTNGWRVSSSEGRSFRLKMTSAIDTPTHVLSSATQPFYTLRLDPTSTSALLTMTRHDPNKAKRLSSSKPGAGLEVLTTTLEEPARRLPPNDGLVALLHPRAASNMALDLSNRPNCDEHTIKIAAEHECARLVWDADARQYYLVHPALSTPFRVTIENSPAWSRVEYTLEHPQLPKNLAKLTRDGSGGGVLEIDTGVAATIESYYVADVAICAVMLVAIEEEKKRNVERFEAPPAPLALLSPKSGKVKKATKVEEMEIDLESQNSSSDKNTKEKKRKLPAPTRGILGLLTLMFKLVVWLLTKCVSVLASLIIGISTCLSKS